MLPPQRSYGDMPLQLATCELEIVCPIVPGHRKVLVKPPTPNVPAPVVESRCRCAMTQEFYTSVVISALYAWCAQASELIEDLPPELIEDLPPDAPSPSKTVVSHESSSYSDAPSPTPLRRRNVGGDNHLLRREGRADDLPPSPTSAIQSFRIIAQSAN